MGHENNSIQSESTSKINLVCSPGYRNKTDISE